MDLSALNITDEDDDSGMPRVLRQALSIISAIGIGGTPDEKFWGKYAAGMKYIERDDMRAVMATDCVDRIFYNRAWMTQELPNVAEYYRDPNFLACVVVHECLHIMRGDAEFSIGRVHSLANIALDCVINKSMMTEGWEFPGCMLRTYDEDAGGPYVANNTAETQFQIYEYLLKKQQEEQKKNGGNQGEPMPADGQGDGDGSGDVDVSEYEARRKDIGGKAATKDYVRRGVAVARAAAQAEYDAENPGDKQETAEQALGAGKGWGKGSLLNGILEDMGLVSKLARNPLANAAGSLMRRGLLKSTRTHRTYAVPHMLGSANGYLMKGKRREPDIQPAIAIDASYSINPADMARYVVEANQWVRAIARGKPLPVCFFQGSVIEQGMLSDYFLGRNVPRPGGGTAFQPVVDWASNLPRKVTHLLIWTDCEALAPSNVPPGLDIYWICAPKDLENHKLYGLGGTLIPSH